MRIKAIRGTKDILPQDCLLWRCIEGEARSLCEIYGYREIRTPFLEEARLFARSIGKSSDIVHKEMYSFSDRKKRRVCLRPEGTASVVRAYLENGLDKSGQLSKFYYVGPMFRSERPQAGRLRQFHHIGVEAIGSLSPQLDAEVILLAVNILRQVRIEDFTVQINTIGCLKDREKYKHKLKVILKKKLHCLCPDCRSRYKTNILRIFDCKNEPCKKIYRQLPTIKDFLCDECAGYFLKVREILDSLNVSYSLNPYLVRGLDYYTKTCFEIIHSRLGAQNALGAGGRYDDLVNELGGPKRAAVGFALGIERMIAAMGSTKIEVPLGIAPYVYIATLGEEPRQAAFKLLQTLRQQGLYAEMDYQNKSLKGQMRLANKLGFRYVAILGEEELSRQIIILRDMQGKTQKEVKIDDLLKELK